MNDFAQRGSSGEEQHLMLNGRLEEQKNRQDSNLQSTRLSPRGSFNYILKISIASVCIYQLLDCSISAHAFFSCLLFISPFPSPFIFLFLFWHHKGLSLFFCLFAGGLMNFPYSHCHFQCLSVILERVRIRAQLLPLCLTWFLFLLQPISTAVFAVISIFRHSDSSKVHHQ